jgi:hypothetical protein
MAAPVSMMLFPGRKGNSDKTELTAEGLARDAFLFTVKF